MTDAAATKPTFELPFYTHTPAEQRIERNASIYFGVTFVGSGVLAAVALIFGAKVFTLNPTLGVLLIPVIAVLILVSVTFGVHKLGADYREKISAPHVAEASAWLRERYGLTLDANDTRTLIYGGIYRVTMPTFTEVGDTKRYGSLVLPGYPGGVQFTQDATNGYRLVDLSDGRELPSALQ